MICHNLQTYTVYTIDYQPLYLFTVHDVLFNISLKGSKKSATYILVSNLI